MTAMKRPIEEKVLGEVLINLGFVLGSATEFRTRKLRVAIYVCPPDRRAILKDLRAIWNPMMQDGDLNGLIPLGTGAQTGDQRQMTILVNQTAIASSLATETNVPDAIMWPPIIGGPLPTLVLEPGDVLEAQLYVYSANTGYEVGDGVSIRASGVEVQL